MIPKKCEWMNPDEPDRIEYLNLFFVLIPTYNYID